MKKLRHQLPLPIPVGKRLTKQQQQQLKGGDIVVEDLIDGN